ncbi:P-loop containing nucleoside triphosphate hydrolase protein [Microthyrium microscopicum]|uniref:P-loop containing nucleoside triphosphate hydrolase protein n=1 Tax=Microthyrium microscopicum TaxID=703497 RepID=A0A6A6TW79_9PEZI|nr:P-loop containing nucleoside triphosphate hydrolase protein [Microthyrium microscopicum]
MSMNRSICVEDYSFGPKTSLHCRNGLDLTLVFEESILSLLPAVLMIVASTVRSNTLRKTRKIISGNSFNHVKAMHLFLLVALRFSLVLIWSFQSSVKTRWSIAAAIVSLLESLAILVLSKLEHTRAIRPSSLLNVYLLLSIGLDFVRMRTLVKMNVDTIVTAISAAAMAAKASLLFLEAQSKTVYFSAPDTERPPQETGGIFNRSVFWWLNSLFLQGYRKVLTLNDLFQLDEELSSEKTLERFERKWKASSDFTNYRLPRTIVLSLTRLFLRPVIPNLVVMSLTFAQPFLVTALLDFVSSEDSQELGNLIILGYTIVYVSLAVFTAIYTNSLDRFVTMLRGCLVSIIYNQTLKLDLKEASGGESLTLMSADVENIVKGFGLIHEASSNLVMAIVALGLLYRQLGLTFLAPLVFSIALSFFTASQSGPYIKRQKKWLEATEARVGFTSSVISSMKGIKIMGLVPKIHEKIRFLRLQEVQQAKKYRLFYALFTVLQTLSLSGTRWITYTVFGIIALFTSSKTLGINRLFTSLAILNIFMERLEILLRQIPATASAFGCLRRIEKFLLLETKRDDRLVMSRTSAAFVDSYEQELQELRGGSNFISTSELHVGWDRQTAVLRGLTIDITPGSFTMVIGPVGSGKSTLLQSLLGETITHKGFIRVASTSAIAYCAQTPWLVNKTIQENILGSSLYDSQWYTTVLRGTALLEDLKNYTAGDQTLIGSQGITLSGGQKQRITLARAVYSRSPVVVLDDIFSGLDPMTEEIIFQSLFGFNGILRNKSQTVILATHAVHRLPASDTVILLAGTGEVVYQGPQSTFPKELIARRMLQETPATDSLNEETISRQAQLMEHTDFTPVLHNPVMVNDASAQDISRQTGDGTVWKYYLKTAGYKHSVLFAILGAICMGFTPAQTLWLNAWASDTDSSKTVSYLGVYTGFFVGEIALTSLWIWHVLIYPMSASSIKLHDIQLDALMGATMEFFSNTDTGKTTNRFSQDLSLIDGELPLDLIDTVEYAYNVLYKMIMIGVATAYLIPVFPFMLIAFWFIQRFYLRTSRQVRFLDLETKAPLYTHFIETLAGLATIRGFGWEEDFRRQNLAALQASQRPFFILKTIQRWLTLVLDLVVSVLAIIVAVLAVELRHSINPGLLGLALVNVMSLGAAMKWLVNFWTSLETSIGAILRIRSFSEETPSEDPHHAPQAPEGWVRSAGIEIKDVTASHGSEADSPAVLRNITLSIAPGEKIGICGRSGSGKSSLLSLLFRTMEARAGAILVDGVDISTISINQVRANLNALSQEPFFLRGTVRENLITAMSTGEPDERLKQVLERVGLWSKFQDLGGLDVCLDSEEALSHGGRQLFCLARALLNPSRILILDEFTSNVDIDTDKAMQKIIREDFKDNTILAVAHRLDTIVDFDRVVVLNHGHIIEQGPPDQLLSDRTSAFRALYDAQG